MPSPFENMVKLFQEGWGRQPNDEELEQLRHDITLGGRTEDTPFGGAFGEPLLGMEGFPIGPRGPLPRVRAPATSSPVPQGSANPQGGSVEFIPLGGPKPRVRSPATSSPVNRGSLVPTPRAPNRAGGPQAESGPTIPMPGPGGTGRNLVPAGPQRGSPFGVQPGARGPQEGFSDFLRNMWRNASPGQQAGGLAAVAGGAGTLWDMLMGGGEGEADPTETALLGQPRAPGTGGGLAMRNELPAPIGEEILSSVPGVDYENLPRPDFESVRERLASLAPEAPDEMNWLEKVPAQAKNIIGMGILLGPLGMLLGAGLGMAENQAREEAEEEAFKQASREHLREMIGFDLDWSKAERAMALEEQTGKRQEAIEDIGLARKSQQWAIEDAQALQNLQMGDLRIGAAQREAAGGNMDIDKIFESAMIQNPGYIMDQYNRFIGAEDYPIEASKQQKEFLDQLFRAGIANTYLSQ